MRFLFLIIALVWACPGVAAADPAVVHANLVKQGEIGYREGWYGRGPARLHYVEAGKGPLVILYHGFPSFWFSWFDQMEVLKRDYRVVAVDGLGSGLSDKPSAMRYYRIERLAAQLDGLARHLSGPRRFALIGHDWGAALAFAYAENYPNRLTAVVGMSAPSYNLFLDLVANDPEQQLRSKYMQRFRTLTFAEIKAGAVHRRIWQQAYGDLVASRSISDTENVLFRDALSAEAINGGMNWYRANIPDFDNISPSNRWPKLNKAIGVPALLIWGEKDQTFVPTFLARMRSRTPMLEITRLPNVGHWTPIEGSASTNAFIRDFLLRADRP